jgi:methionyl-tRNA formyltransferase
MRILFAGSPEIAVPSLRALAELARQDGRFELAGILTNADSPKGRHGTPEPTPVGRAGEEIAARAREEGRRAPALLKPEGLGGEGRALTAALKPDLLVSFAYGRIFGPRFLALFPLGGINIHPSLLPKYRGASPIQAAILGREAETGISIQWLATEMDSGNILLQESFPLTGRETAADLGALAAEKSAALLCRVLGEELYRCGGSPQDHGAATYCARIAKEDGRIDWTRGAADIDAQVRAFTPWPLCLTRHGDLELHILAGRPWEGKGENPGGGARAAPGTVLGADKNRGILIQTGDGVFAAERLQYRGKKALDWRSFLNGAKNFDGSRLG